MAAYFGEQLKCYVSGKKHPRHFIYKINLWTFLHGNKILMDNTDPAIEHLDGTVYSCKMSSHCAKSSISLNRPQRTFGRIAADSKRL
jgi:hypothetical protein